MVYNLVTKVKIDNIKVKTNKTSEDHKEEYKEDKMDKTNIINHNNKMVDKKIIHIKNNKDK
jgi:hypothetical protein